MVNLISKKNTNSIKFYIRFNGKVAKIYLATLLSFGMVSVSQANIVVDANAENSQQPTVVESNDAAPIINIRAANAEGISHNKYTQFDVDARGVVLNNFVSAQSGDNSIDSPLESHLREQILIGSNEYLRANIPARIILNEVTSLAGPSKLNGPIAVVGQKADVIIANPAGIECNGCGFINTAIANLSAATPLLTEGSVKFLTDNIHDEITFSGAGLSKEANQSDHTTLIADKIKINAPVYANKGLYVNLSGDKDSMHTASLNLSELGSMHADKIFIRGLGKNIGVHNKGEIKANAGLILQISGLLDNPGVISSSEYFDINSENFNITFNKDEIYSLARITDNMMTKENDQGVKSEERSIMSEFSPKFQSADHNMVNEIYERDKHKIKKFKDALLLAKGNYHIRFKQELDWLKVKNNTPPLIFSLDLNNKKANYFFARDEYEKKRSESLNEIVQKNQQAFTNSDYSLYQNMDEEKTKQLLMDNNNILHDL